MLSRQYSVAQKRKIDDYAFDFITNYDDDDNRTRNITVSAYSRYGNELMAVNDPFGTPVEPNVMFVEITYKDWPYVFVFTKANEIRASTELLIKYSESYWNIRRGEASEEYGGIVSNQRNFKGREELVERLMKAHESESIGISGQGASARSAMEEDSSMVRSVYVAMRG